MLKSKGFPPFFRVSLTSSSVRNDTLHLLLFHQTDRDSGCSKPPPAASLLRETRQGTSVNWKGPAVSWKNCSVVGPSSVPRNCCLSPPGGPFVFILGRTRIGRLEICTRFALIQITLSSLINFFNIRTLSSSGWQGVGAICLLSERFSSRGEKVVVPRVLPRVRAATPPPSAPA